METIIPGRTQISDRFPVASFTVSVPEDRYFEITCATDPRLFHRDHSRQRSPRNFYSSRVTGLLRAPRGHTTYLLPPEQLQRFSGAQRLYYALATYGGPHGEQARFSISPRTLDRVPSIGLSADFTGRTLDRSRIGRPAQEPLRYGAPEVPLSWGGDDALAASAARPVYAGNPHEYDDGFDASLWKQSAPAPSPSPPPHRRYRGAAFESDDYDGMDTDADASGAESYGDENSPEAEASLAEDDSEEYEDAVELTARGGATDNLRRVDAPQAAVGAGSTQPASVTRFGRPVQPLAAEEEEWEDAPALASAEAPVTVVQPAGLAQEAAAPSPPASSGRDDDYREEEATEEELPQTVEALQSVPAAPAARLGIPEKFAIVELVARAESGRERYAAINADTEYNTPGHKAYQRYHIGLSWGMVHFTQRGGALGRVLSACQRRDPREFSRRFGADSAELLRVTNAATWEERVAPVGGHNLWEEPWLTRFRQAGTVGPFQAAQNEVAITDYLDVNLQLAAWLGFTTDRALAMLYDRCVHMGNGGGVAWVMRHVGPVRSQADLSACLAALGFGDLKAFQASVHGLRDDGKWGRLTHAAMTQALRGLGGSSPVTVLALPVMLDRLVTAATGRRFEQRVRTLRTTPELHDTVYQVP